MHEPASIEICKVWQKEEHHILLSVYSIFSLLLALLCQDARAAGCKTVSGVEMFIGQAAEQFELFTGQEAPIDLMRQVVLTSLGQ